MTIPTSGSGTAGTSVARVILSGAFNGNAEATVRDDEITNSGSPLKVETTNLASGWNALTVPAGAKLVSIVPPSTNAQTLTLKGATGDTGIALDPAVGARLVSLGTSPTLGVTAGGTVNGVQVIWL